MACGPHAAINARDRMKPEPRSCPGIEHQCVIGLSLPSYFQHRKPVKWRPVSAARDCPQGRLPLVRATSRLSRKSINKFFRISKHSIDFLVFTTRPQPRWILISTLGWP